MHDSTTIKMERALLDQAQKKGQHIAQLIAALLTNPLYNGELSRIGEISKTVRKRADISYFYVLDPEFRVVHDGTTQIKLYGSLMNDAFTRRAFTDNKIQIKIKRDMMQVVAPIAVSRKIIGAIKFCVVISDIRTDIAILHKSLETIKKQTQKDILFIAIAVMGVLSLLGIIFSVLIARWLSRPIEEFFQRRNEDLESSNIALQDEIAERRKIELALRQSERRSRDFAADAAHELRTPLAVLRTQLDSLEDKEIAEGLRQDVESMSRMVEQLMAATRLDFLAIGPDDRADLAQVCRRVAEHIAPIAIHQGRSVEVIGADTPVSIHGNADALEQAVRNLVENALKHSNPNTTVTIELDHEPSIKVTDHGDGIPADQRDVIFRRFWRTDSPSGGAGLGLSIVQKTVDIHNGTIDILDNPQGGTIFTIHLPQAV